jgi:vitamin B12 transporter
MPVSALLRADFARRARAHSAFAFLLARCHARCCPAASIRGVVTDASGAKVTGANVICSATASRCHGRLHGRRQLSDSDRDEGRFFLVVSAKSFRQLETPGFYAGRLDNVERNVVLSRSGCASRSW